MRNGGVVKVLVRLLQDGQALLDQRVGAQDQLREVQQRIPDLFGVGCMGEWE